MRFVGGWQVPYPFGPTHPSNLKLLCRCHHLLKTFWGWHDKQLPDATIIWTLPNGHTYVTTPGSAPLFPSLCVPTGDLPAPDPARADRRGDPTVMMPIRKATRAANRARYIDAERRYNQRIREAETVAIGRPHYESGPAPPTYLGNEPPPF